MKLKIKKIWLLDLLVFLILANRFLLPEGMVNFSMVEITLVNLIFMCCIIYFIFRFNLLIFVPIGIMIEVLYVSFTSPRGEAVEMDDICSFHDNFFLILSVIGFFIAIARLMRTWKSSRYAATSKYKIFLILISSILGLLSLVGIIRSIYALIYLDEGLCPL